VAVVGQYLYAVGGFDDSSPLNSIERYDPVTNQWTYVASMNTCRGGVGAGAMGERIWAVGGHNGSQYLGSMESYNPVEDVWVESGEMSTPRAGSGVAGCLCDVEILKDLNSLERSVKDENSESPTGARETDDLV
jgi:kelch-like protein 8